MYHNTTNQTGEQLDIFSVAAKTQDELILDFFKRTNPISNSPSNVHRILLNLKMIDSNTPLTSIRRSITNLTKQGKLIKTDEQVKSIYGRPEYVWKLK